MHPLHDEVFIQLFGENSRRRTGRTTAAVLNALAQAILFPGQKVFVMDHYPTIEANRHMLRMVMEFAARLDLKHIHCEPNGKPYPYIVFERRT